MLLMLKVAIFIGEPVLHLRAPRIIPEAVTRAALRRFEPRAWGHDTDRHDTDRQSLIEEGADYGSDQTQPTCNGGRSDGNCRGAAPVCSEDWTRRSHHVLLRKRSRSHSL